MSRPEETGVPIPRSQQDSAVKRQLEHAIGKYLSAYSRLYEVHGTVLITERDRTLFRKSCGLADQSLEVKNRTTTRYKIGSITKQFTAAAVLKLEEEGRLSVDDRVSRYLPDVPYGRRISIHDLLSHSSGLYNYTEAPGLRFYSRQPVTPDRIIGRIRRKPLKFPSGSKAEYSNTGYILLGKIIEIVSGVPYADFIREKILVPCGLGHTGVCGNDAVVPGLAHGYKYRHDIFQNADYMDMDWAWSAGGMYSTVDDLHRWNRGLHQSGFLKPASRKKMFSPRHTLYGMKTGYGLFIQRSGSRVIRLHTGSIFGFIALNLHIPSIDVSVTGLFNFEGQNLGLMNPVVDLILGKAAAPPRKPERQALSAEDSAKICGRYRSQSYKGMKAEISDLGGGLYRFSTKSPYFDTSGTYYPAGPLLLKHVEIDEHIEFSIDKKHRKFRFWHFVKE